MRGLSPLPDLDQDALEGEEEPPTPTAQTPSKSTHHQPATSVQNQPKPSKSGVQLGAKRKAQVRGRNDEQNEGGPAYKKSKGADGGALKKEKKDKGKGKAVKGLLSFGDDG